MLKSLFTFGGSSVMSFCLFLFKNYATTQISGSDFVVVSLEKQI